MWKNCCWFSSILCISFFNLFTSSFSSLKCSPSHTWSQSVVDWLSTFWEDTMSSSSSSSSNHAVVMVIYDTQRCNNACCMQCTRCVWRWTCPVCNGCMCDLDFNFSHISSSGTALPVGHRQLYGLHCKISVYPRTFCGETSIFNGTDSVGDTFVSVSWRDNEAQADIAMWACASSGVTKGGQGGAVAPPPWTQHARVRKNSPKIFSDYFNDHKSKFDEFGEWSNSSLSQVRSKLLLFCHITGLLQTHSSGLLAFLLLCFQVYFNWYSAVLLKIRLWSGAEPGVLH